MSEPRHEYIPGAPAGTYDHCARECIECASVQPFYRRYKSSEPLRCTVCGKREGAAHQESAAPVDVPSAPPARTSAVGADIEWAPAPDCKEWHDCEHIRGRDDVHVYPTAAWSCCVDGHPVVTGVSKRAAQFAAVRFLERTCKSASPPGDAASPPASLGTHGDAGTSPVEIIAALPLDELDPLARAMHGDLLALLRHTLAVAGKLEARADKMIAEAAKLRAGADETAATAIDVLMQTRGAL